MIKPFKLKISDKILQNIYSKVKNHRNRKINKKRMYVRLQNK